MASTTRLTPESVGPIHPSRRALDLALSVGPRLHDLFHGEHEKALQFVDRQVCDFGLDGLDSALVVNVAKPRQLLVDSSIKSHATESVSSRVVSLQSRRLSSAESCRMVVVLLDDLATFAIGLHSGRTSAPRGTVYAPNLYDRRDAGSRRTATACSRTTSRLATRLTVRLVAFLAE
jgi:hypothetical protein